ncbi:hypothetical protein [Krasilnikovia sp. MM14-A1259]|uniref:hypothetical protein n=1 Tax=Krasilnikovia sp. MM14-A1259 TaxID=3373539 RepID=UPI0037F8A9C9
MRVSEGDGPWLGWVDNGDDPPDTARYLRIVDSYRRSPGARDDYQPVVVRPTPGGGDRTATGFDLLAALGKLPHVMQHEQFRLRQPDVWDSAVAWLIGSGITDLVIDRAHQLPRGRLLDLAAAATRAAATPWMIWSGPDDEAAALEVKNLTAAGYHVARMSVTTMHSRMPDPHPATKLAAAPAPASPTLPTADFTTFRAACRRHLGRDAFTRVDAEYRGAVERTDQWMAHLRHLHPGDDLLILPPALTDVAAPLVGWLRDVQIGPTPDAGTALITLRATQAALFGHAILLRWTPDALGPDPGGRLPGDLTRTAAAAINTGARTASAAATALALHLNLAPIHLHCLRVGHVADDGSYLDGPPDSSTGHHHGLAHALLSAESPSGIAERACAGTILIPRHARSIIAAHLAYRRGQGAEDHDPYFVHRLDPRREPTAMLREAAVRTCRRLNLNPPWLHRDPCKYGADVGLTRRTQGWLVERGLALAQLDRYAAARRPAYRYQAARDE